MPTCILLNMIFCHIHSVPCAVTAMLYMYFCKPAWMASVNSSSNFSMWTPLRCHRMPALLWMVYPQMYKESNVQFTERTSGDPAENIGKVGSKLNILTFNIL